ncbi:rhodanese-like domain-containing protein [Merismopedia glauca]|uniref:Rhodanese-related sulfurtransferase n=1 Tax=Merismopedia glauca CCAP 1448/3 TaxID=1296344 RepID=A0A2T1C371_9CYAN|nr:rhodanese-like domain-containing protein [Merismopedia glauca]PSB02711.1 rhodanese-related sulfurtransferase [Merismopedia glauca CCAP 1448/3]
MIAAIKVQELAEKLNSDRQEVQLIDVREPGEIAIAQIPHFSNLPLSQFAQWSDRILELFNPELETIVLCHHGIRSAQMCQWLSSQGFTNLKNVSGGIDAYSEIVDLSVPRY